MNCTIAEEPASKEARAVRVTPEGDIDLHVAPEFRKILHKVLEGKPPLLIVDLSKVPFIDSSGIATIVEAAKRLKGRGSVRVEGSREKVRDTFEIAGLTKIFEIP
jgi:anti-sigma B factor antagonist